MLSTNVEAKGTYVRDMNGTGGCLSVPTEIRKRRGHLCYAYGSLTDEEPQRKLHQDRAVRPTYRNPDPRHPWLR